ncbi:MAG: bifunctional riboflavin kinase/FAD synthetase [Lachnospiraceae bacterium]|nr:bifunctional riboflavin kinase/FAD synthetase [Lachnospiraceae bacterium]
MEIIKDINQIQWRPTAITIGKFDGVHIGHQKLLRKVLKAKEDDCTAVVFTFDRVPGNQAVTLQSFLTLEEEKQHFMQEFGMDCYVMFPFTKETAAMEPEQFVSKILVKTMRVKKLYVGSDFRFGKDRKGDVVLLAELAKRFGFTFEAIEKETYLDEVVSSSRVRDCVLNGKAEEITAMLNRPYLISGSVIHGRKLGRTIGIPTINVALPEGKIRPKSGVYCTRVRVDGKSFFGITNIGTKPTVQDEPVYGAETYLFDCNEDLYEKEVTIELLHFVREEKKFSSVEELSKQLEQDKQYGIAYVKGLEA